MDAKLDVRRDAASAKKTTVPVAQDASVLAVVTCQRGLVRDRQVSNMKTIEWTVLVVNLKMT